MKQIHLTKGKVATVDDADYDWLVSMGKWCVSGNYAAKGFSVFLNGKKRKVMRRMHRVIMNAPNELQVDHINGDGFDNRRCNLRLCTPGENTRNAKRPKTNTSGFKGVFKSGKKWQVKIKLNDKAICLGSFSDKIEAAKVYNEAALKYHGDFANLNEIPK